ncbi:MAG TPA: phage holin family protein [Patescibacteria group bacterium]|jgi:putative membrane protein|nr:phage holin family protein [Patescibacteria group bacterium]
MKQQFSQFLLRWALNGFGLWIAARLLAGHGFMYDAGQGLSLFFFAGLVLSIVNVILKPIVVILSLPAILLTLGLFTFIVNGSMVYLVGRLVPGLEVHFWAAVLAGMVISLINYVLTSLLDLSAKETK